MNAMIQALFRKTFATLREQKAEKEAWDRARHFVRVGYRRYKENLQTRESRRQEQDAKRIRQLTNRALDRIDWKSTDINE